MKSFPSILSLLILAALPLQSGAVTTAHCPKTLTLVAEGFDLRKTADDVIRETQYEDYEDVIAATKESIQYIGETLEQTEFSLSLKAAKNGRCQYRGAGNEKIEISSSKGQDKLMMQTLIGPGGQLLRIYVDGITLDENGLTLPEKRVAMYLAIPRAPYTDYAEGGPLVKIGFVDRVELK